MGTSISHPQTGKNITLRVSVDCNSVFVVYCIKCPCGKLYVGKTERKIRVRITEHKSLICNRNPNSSLASHWVELNHTIPQLRFLVLEKINILPERDIAKNLSQRETWWIKFLNTMLPSGLNEKIDMGCYL